MQKTVSSPCPFSRLATAGAVVLSLGLAVGCGPESTSSPDARRLTDAPVGGTDANVPTDASVTDASVTDAGLADATVVVPDATIVPPDAMVMVDAAAPVLGHLLLSEIVVTPDDGEYIEIYNPTSAPIDLTNYYLSDDADYAKLPGMTGATDGPSINTNVDFLVQFPAGASIASGQAVTVAFRATGFVSTYSVDPTFSIGSTAGSSTQMITVIGGGGSTGLTNTGESAVLFFWDGMSDLVTDVDCLNIGTPSITNSIGDKSGLMVDGPDMDTTPSTYLNDSVAVLQLTDPVAGLSTKRVLPEGMNEVDMGGNGILGHDETSENIQVTWDSTYSAPTPNVSDIVVP
ncbi:MAG: lamin tail domain-containing protein [Kofleriaceae bacterium]|nr:lamin tail domain-containing protein [Kofleriaceae bacterium]